MQSLESPGKWMNIKEIPKEVNGILEEIQGILKESGELRKRTNEYLRKRMNSLRKLQASFEKISKSDSSVTHNCPYDDRNYETSHMMSPASAYVFSYRLTFLISPNFSPEKKAPTETLYRALR